MSSLRRALAGIVGTAVAVAGVQTIAATAASANTAGTGLVINEVYGGGGSTSTSPVPAYRSDWVELYNPTSAPISLSGDSLQYRSASYTTGTVSVLDLPDADVASHGYYLVQVSSDTSCTGGATCSGAAVPSPDFVGSALNMSASGGQVILSSGTVPITTTGLAMQSAPGVIDFVGYGSSPTSAESAKTGTATSALLSVQRAGAGVDTDNNAADFAAPATPTPQGAGGGSTALGLAAITDQTAITGSPVSITPHASGGTTPYTFSATGVPAGLSIDPSTGAITGSPSAEGASDITVTVTDATSATASQSFTLTASDPTVVSIAQIQGTDTDTSPLVGQTVTTQGVVTADYPTGGFNGFTVQTGGTGGTTDATQGASDAVFAYGSASAMAVHVGDSVSVTGVVQEFQGETELSNVSVSELPTALTAVTPAQLSWSDLDTDAKREAHESELIAPQGDYTVTDNYNLNYYGTIVLAADSSKPLYGPTDVATPGSADAQAQATFNATHAITLDDGSSWNYSSTHTGDPLPWLTQNHSVTIGAAVSFGSEGVILDYRNATWNYQPTHQVTDMGTDVATFTDMRGTVNAAPQDVGGDVRLATFNMENFFVETGEAFVADGLGHCTFYQDREGNEITDRSCSFTDGSPGPRGAATDVSFQRQLAKEVWGVNHLGASIVSLEEVENSAKYGEDRDHALSVFVEALNAQAGAGTWAFIPTNDLTQPSIATQDVIRSALIYKPSMVTPAGAASILSDDSGENEPFSIAREPLAQAFKGVQEPASSAFLVVSNHFKSKGADATGLYDDCGTGHGDAESTDPASDQGGFNCTRVHEANDMSTWAGDLASQAGIQPIFMLGDFNAYTHEDPMQALYAKGYTDLQTAENGAGAKASYSYGGEEGSLDHVLANAAGLAMVTGADVWQIDGQEPVAYVYSRYNYNVSQLFSADNAFGTSDHDPEVVGLDLPSVSTALSVGSIAAQSWASGAAITPVTATATGGAAPYTFSASGLPAGVSINASTGAITGTPAAAGSGSATLTVTDSASHSVGTSFSWTVAAAGPSAKVTARITVKTTPKKIRAKRTKVTITVSVTAPGLTPTGTVAVTVDGRTYRVTLANGKATVRKVVFRKPGKKRHVIVTYAGDSAVQAATFTANVKVVR